MSSILQSINQNRRSFIPSIMSTATKRGKLPVSHTDPKEGGLQLRRRLSSLSFKIQGPAAASLDPDAAAAAASSWGFRQSKSVSSMGEYAGSSIRKWWEWGWGWILSRKPTFAKDLELNEQETVVLGCHNKGSWRHVFYKVRSEFRRLVGSDNYNNVLLPQTFRSPAAAGI